MKCFFCKDPAVHRCNWPVDQPATLSHWDLTEDHIIVTNQAKRHLRPLTVRRFNRTVAGLTYPVTMYALRFPKDEYFLYYLYGTGATARVQVLNPSVCGNAVCEKHLRELGDDTRYCMEHWGSWQTVDLGAAINKGVEIC